MGPAPAVRIRQMKLEDIDFSSAAHPDDRPMHCENNGAKMKKLISRTILILLLLSTGSPLMPAQAASIKPVNFGDSFPAFTLPAVQGGEVSLAALKGKNVLIVFPRGRVGDHWCQICHYQYAELAAMEKKLQFRKKYNLEVLFVLPYDKATVEHWASILPEQLAVVESWKNPTADELKDPAVKSWMERSRLLFSKHLLAAKENPELPFPILIDGERKLSQGLQIFTMFWDRSYVEQNIATVFLLDKEGLVRFKYLSQNTVDRPSAEFMLKFVERML
jgi:peroxiredoxin